MPRAYMAAVCRLVPPSRWARVHCAACFETEGQALRRVKSTIRSLCPFSPCICRSLASFSHPWARRCRRVYRI